MTDRELDVLAAQYFLGWSDFWTDDARYMGKSPQERAAGADGVRVSVPEFGTDHNAARLLEDEIERRGLIDDYAAALLSMKTESGYIQGDHAFLIRATPAQRRDAALKVAGNL